MQCEYADVVVRAKSPEAREISSSRDEESPAIVAALCGKSLEQRVGNGVYDTPVGDEQVGRFVTQLLLNHFKSASGADRGDDAASVRARLKKMRLRVTKLVVGCPPQLRTFPQLRFLIKFPKASLIQTALGN